MKQKLYFYRPSGLTPLRRQEKINLSLLALRGLLKEFSELQENQISLSNEALQAEKDKLLESIINCCHQGFLLSKPSCDSEIDIDWHYQNIMSNLKQGKKVPHLIFLRHQKKAIEELLQSKNSQPIIRLLDSDNIFVFDACLSARILDEDILTEIYKKFPACRLYLVGSSMNLITQTQTELFKLNHYQLKLHSEFKNEETQKADSIYMRADAKQTSLCYLIKTKHQKFINGVISLSKILLEEDKMIITSIIQAINKNDLTPLPIETKLRLLEMIFEKNDLPENDSEKYARFLLRIYFLNNKYMHNAATIASWPSHEINSVILVFKELFEKMCLDYNNTLFTSYVMRGFFIGDKNICFKKNINKAHTYMKLSILNGSISLYSSDETISLSTMSDKRIANLKRSINLDILCQYLNDQIEDIDKKIKAYSCVPDDELFSKSKNVKEEVNKIASLLSEYVTMSTIAHDLLSTNQIYLDQARMVLQFMASRSSHFDFWNLPKKMMKLYDLLMTNSYNDDLTLVKGYLQENTLQSVIAPFYFHSQ